MDECLTAQVDDVRDSLRNYTAVQLNSLQKWLGDLIEPVLALALVKDRWVRVVGKGFPSRVKDFQRLVLDPTTLLKLVKYYLVRDWERQKRATLRDTKVTCYMDLKVAVTEHPYKCLKALAIIQGL